MCRTGIVLQNALHLVFVPSFDPNSIALCDNLLFAFDTGSSVTI